MATIINNPPATNTVSSQSEERTSNSWLFAIIFLILFVVLFVYFIMPVIRRAATPVAPQVNVPGKIDVNVNTPNQ